MNARVSQRNWKLKSSMIGIGRAVRACCWELTSWRCSQRPLRRGPR